MKTQEEVEGRKRFEEWLHNVRRGRPCNKKKARALELLGMGWKQRRVARELDIPLSTVNDYARESGKSESGNSESGKSESGNSGPHNSESHNSESHKTKSDKTESHKMESSKVESVKEQLEKMKMKAAMNGQAARDKVTPHRRSPDEQTRRAASLYLDQNRTREQAAKETGLGEKEVQLAIERERGRRQAEIEIDPETLSIAARQKLAMAIRQHQRQLDMKLEERVQERIDQWMEQFRPHIEDAVRIKRGRHGIITKDEASAIKRSLHPDNSAGPETRTKAFIVWQRVEHMLLTEEDAPTIVPLPPRRKAQG